MQIRRCGWIVLFAVLFGSAGFCQAKTNAERPNILWITCEDISPNLGCYGDKYAVTPHLDRFAGQATRYNRAFAPIGVCAPSRSSLITGVHASSLGSQHMRCEATLPDDIKCFPEYLRDAGYYCTNNVKTDYNFKASPRTWDESSAQAHWKGRKAAQPFFSVFNFISSHESQIRLSEEQYHQRTAKFTIDEFHSTALVPLPPYHPDTPEVRRDWARYYDTITYMDGQVGDLLKQLDDEGLADNTIVFFFSDHGAGMPRSKRWLYESSTRVPLLVRVPKKFKALQPDAKAGGGETDRLLSFVDFGPTVLSLAGLKPPAHMQGGPFLGREIAEPRKYVYGFRDRMDERYDMIRSVRDERYRYIRNFMPHLPYFREQYISFMYEMPTMQQWARLAAQGKLTGPAAAFMAAEKPVEELYDTWNDPWEVNNLAGKLAEVQDRLSRELKRWMLASRDLGVFPEPSLRTRFGRLAPYDAARPLTRNCSADPRRVVSDSEYERILDAAWFATQRDPSQRAEIAKLFEDHVPDVRFWGATGLAVLAKDAKAEQPVLRKALEDYSPSVRLAAADALVRQGEVDAVMPVLIAGLNNDSPWVRLMASNVLSRMKKDAAPALEPLRKCCKDPNEYVARVCEDAVETITGFSEKGGGMTTPPYGQLQEFVRDFVLVTPGKHGFAAEFTMGRDYGAHLAERPAHAVTLDHSFAINMYEVTQRQWELVMGDNPSRWKGPRNSVEMLDHEEAQDFCRRVTGLLREKKLITQRQIVRLPSETEWEYCARAGTQTGYCFGDDAKSLGEYAWFTGNAAGNDPPVGAKKPNAWGLYDMHGYLWEWCADNWHDTALGAPAGGVAWLDGGDNTKAVLRSGSWKDSATELASAYRRRADKTLRDDAVGLRCVLADEP